MNIGSWTPESENTDSVSMDHDLLAKFIRISEDGDLTELNCLLTDAEKAQSAIMLAGKDVWFETAEAYDNEQLIHLVRFFTLAEKELSGWEAGAESPVVWLVKVLRRRKSPPEKDLLLWIKANSDNRFLPNGAL